MIGKLFVKHKVDESLYQYNYCELMALEMFKDGKSIGQIAEIFDVSRNTISRWLNGVCEDKKIRKVLNEFKKTYASPKIKKVGVAKEVKQEAVSLLEKGTSYCEVGRKFNVSDNAIRKWVKSLGLDPKDYGRFGKKNKKEV